MKYNDASGFEMLLNLREQGVEVESHQWMSENTLGYHGSAPSAGKKRGSGVIYWPLGRV